MGDVIGIVRMQHGPVCNRVRQIQGPARARAVGKVNCQHTAGGVIAHVIADAEIVTLASDDHVIVAVIAHLGRAFELMRHHRTGNGQGVALAFLAAKSTTHSARFDPHRMHGLTDGVGDFVLNFSGMLGGGMDQHIAIVLWQGAGGLAFEVEMLLPADLKCIAQAHGRIDQHGLRLPAFPNHRIAKTAVGGKRLINGQNGVFVRNVELGQTRGLACRQMRGRRDQKHGLSDIMHLVRGQEWLIMHGWGNIIGKGQVRGGHHGDHARRMTHLCQIKPIDLTRSHRGLAKCQMHGVGGQGDVIDIARRTRNMQFGGIMGQGFGDAHGVTSSTWVGWPDKSWKYRISRFWATRKRYSAEARISVSGEKS